MKVFLIIFSAIILLNGCASYSQIMVNAQGEKVICSAYGQGVVGIAQADIIQGDCISSFKSAGYIEIEKAGVVGVYLREPLETDTLVSVLKVVPKSPAAYVGIIGGDVILYIDGQKIRKRSDANTLLFGLAGTGVEIIVLREGKIRILNINRASFTSVYGTPSKSR